MSKKKNEKKVVPLTPAPVELTPEQIAEQMKKDEEEMDRRLARFMAANPMPESSGVEEQEDDEEETITLDFTEGGIKAYEKKETVIIKDEEGNIKQFSSNYTIEDEEEFVEKIKSIIETEKKPPLQQKYQDMITEKLVSKAIAKMVSMLDKAAMETGRAVRASVRIPGVSDKLSTDTYELIYARKEELKKAWKYGRVDWDNIPEWAHTYIDEYIEEAIWGIASLTERD